MSCITRCSGWRRDRVTEGGYPCVTGDGVCGRSGNERKRGGGSLARLQPERLVDESRVVRFGTGCGSYRCVCVVAQSAFLCFVL